MMKSLRGYRVWHTDKKHCSKFDEKTVTEVSAISIIKAREIVQNMFPSHRISTCWLIEK